MPGAPDSFDLNILRVLQADSSIPTTELASRVGLSQAPCWRRLQKLRAEGYIKAEVAVLDRKKLGFNTQIFALVKMTAHGRGDLSDFAASMMQLPHVLDCFVILGSFDFLLRIVTTDIEAYEKFILSQLSQVPGVQEINSLVALSEIKSTTQLPLDTAG